MLRYTGVNLTPRRGFASQGLRLTFLRIFPLEYTIGNLYPRPKPDLVEKNESDKPDIQCHGLLWVGTVCTEL